MFRFATLKELDAMLEVCGLKFRTSDAEKIVEASITPNDNAAVVEDEDNIAIKELSWNTILTQHFVKPLESFVSVEMRNDDLLQDIEMLTGTEVMCPLQDRRLDGGSQAFRIVCENLTNGIISVLERDFIQLFHGSRGQMLTNRPGIAFLLCGICLGVFYQAVDEKTKQGLDLLILRGLKFLVDPSVWAKALECYGPAQAVSTSEQRLRIQTMTGRAGKAARKRALKAAKNAQRGMSRSPVGLRAKYVTDPDYCPVCKSVCSPDEMLLQCQECGSVSLRYTQFIKQQRDEKKSSIESIPAMLRRGLSGDIPTGRGRASSV